LRFFEEPDTQVSMRRSYTDGSVLVPRIMRQLDAIFSVGLIATSR
jgi:hypothetical protein